MYDAEGEGDEDEDEDGDGASGKGGGKFLTNTVLLLSHFLILRMTQV